MNPTQTKQNNTFCSLTLWSATFLLLCTACGPAGLSEEMGFTLLEPGHTGIDFSNDLTPTLDLNIIDYMYYYNGGGVACGDFNQDGLPDLFFTANQEDNRLYLNDGELKFRDVTETAGLQGLPGWTTGATIADVNADGRLDIYVSQLGELENIRGRNQLYINLGNDAEGVPVFEDRAELYGLDLVGYGTQAAFFDYDLDGDLDMYQLNHSLHKQGTFGPRKQFEGTYDDRAGDRLFRNDGRTFTEVTREAGIHSNALGYGLGLSIADINLDGWPDIYVGNDYHEDDYLYLNNQDGTFRDVATEAMRHTSRFSMGNDVGDINNDGFPDIISLDMLPRDPEILKASETEIAYDLYDFRLGYGYGYQYSRNALQLNRGNLPQNAPDMAFSEVGLLSGISATDWSWSALFADFDNSGTADLFISNGIYGRPNDLDFINFISAEEIQIRIAQNAMGEEELALVEAMPKIRIPNFIYRNDGGLSFTDVSEAWGIDQASYSSGAVYADLDLDGDLDLVVNNTNEPAFILRNEARQLRPDRTHYLSINLEGGEVNPYGFGATILAETSHGALRRENFVARGFQSAVSPTLHLGLGADSLVNKLTVIWPGGAFQTLTDLPADQALTLTYGDASGSFDYEDWRSPYSGETVFEQADTLGWVHEENKFVEFNREPLIPHMSSTEGPAMAIGDANGDGLDDLFLGGAKWQPGQVMFQKPNGTWATITQVALEADARKEDVDAAWTDVDNDGDLDLVVATGGNEFPAGRPENEIRLYLNDGSGKLAAPESGWPAISMTASCVLPHDFDRDGDIDLFFGGRTVVSNYGEPPMSYLLVNDGTGQFGLADLPALKDNPGLGLIRAGAWADLNGDGWSELVLAREWDTPLILDNREGSLSIRSDEASGFAGQEGWWSAVEAADMDGDGDLDLLLGNLGLNSRLKASAEEPVRLYYADFDGNGKTEQLLTHYIDGKEYLFATKDEISAQLVSLKKKYLKYADFAKAPMNELFPEAQLDTARLYLARNFASSYAENMGNGRFSLKPLPLETQFSPIMAMTAHDFDRDGILDVLAAGNFYETNIRLGRYDASYGSLLKGDGQGGLTPISADRSGLFLEGQSRKIAWINNPDGQPVLAISRNKAPISLWLWNRWTADPDIPEN